MCGQEKAEERPRLMMFMYLNIVSTRVMRIGIFKRKTSTIDDKLSRFDGNKNLTTFYVLFLKGN